MISTLEERKEIISSIRGSMSREQAAGDSWACVETGKCFVPAGAERITEELREGGLGRKVEEAVSGSTECQAKRLVFSF